jgi:hypothetical protein
MKQLLASRRALFANLGPRQGRNFSRRLHPHSYLLQYTREHERTVCEQLDADIEGCGNSWERVVKMVDLQQVCESPCVAFSTSLFLPGESLVELKRK